MERGQTFAIPLPVFSEIKVTGFDDKPAVPCPPAIIGRDGFLIDQSIQGRLVGLDLGARAGFGKRPNGENIPHSISTWPSRPGRSAG